MIPYCVIIIYSSFLTIGNLKTMTLLSFTI